MTRPRGRRVALLGLAALAVAAAAVLLVDPFSDDRRGRLESFVTFGERVGTPMSPGQRLTDGFAAVINTGDADVEFVKVEPIGVTGRLPPHEISIAGEGRGKPRVPPQPGEAPEDVYAARTLKPVAGFVLPPNRKPGGREGAAIVLAYGPLTEGRFGYKGLKVTYRTGGDTETVTVRTASVVCVAPKQDCDPRPESAGAPPGTT